MEDLIKEYLTSHNLTDYLKYAKIFEKVIEFLFFGILLGTLKYFWGVFQEYQLSKDLSPYWDKPVIQDYTRNYVPAQGQDITPSEKEELKDSWHYEKNPLIPFFLDLAFSDRDDNKYYLVLADTGMGKTAFMINLYLAYKSQKFKFWKRNFWKNLFFPLNDIQLFPLGSSDTLEKIDAIDKSKKRNTILLLDALDEDNQAIENHEKRIQEIIDKTKDFHDIVITSRTQFFASREKEPLETGVMKFGSEKGSYEFFRKYISPFDEKDIRSFLNKKYGIFRIYNIFKKNKAKRVIAPIPNLRVRPMLLSYIDDLVQTDRKLYYIFEIYEELINKWIIRESNNYKKEKRQSFTEELKKFSRIIALDMYSKRKEREGLYIEGNSIGVFAIENNIDLTAMELKGRSLLNRNTAGRYKFAHKSILEYYLAVELFENETFREDFDFESMSFTKELFDEMFFVKIVSKEIERIDSKLYSFLPEKINKIDVDKFIELCKKITIPEDQKQLYLDALNLIFSKIIKELNKDEKRRAYCNRGDVYYYQTEYQKAIEDYSKAIELDSKYDVAYNNRGLAYQNQKNYYKAIEDYTEAIKIDPKFATAYSNRGSAYRNLKEYQKAIEECSKAIELNPKHSTAYNNRGIAYLNLKDYDKAIEAFTEAIKLDPKDATAYNNRGIAYSDLKDYDKAFEDYTEVIKLDPKGATAYNNRGNAYYDLKDYDKAIEDYTEAIKLDPKYAAAYYNRGNAYRNLKDYDKAIEDYTEAIKINPTNPNYHSNLPQILFIVNKDSEAIESLNKAFSLNPTEPDLLSELYFYAFAHVPERREEAKQKLQELIVENIRENGENSILSDWDFSKNIEKAIREGHPEPELLKEFAKKITGKEN